MTTGITGAGQFNIFNKYGTVNVVIDVVGYYADHSHTVTNLDTTNEPGIAFGFQTELCHADLDAGCDGLHRDSGSVRRLCGDRCHR